MKKDNYEPGFDRFRNDLYSSLLLLDSVISNPTGRQIKAILLILRLSIGCNKKWAKIKLSEFIVVGIDSTHIRDVIEPLINKKVIEWNQKDKKFKINIDFLLSELTKIASYRKELLSFLIGQNIPQETSQNGSPRIANKRKKQLLKLKENAYQNGKLDKQEIGTLKDINTDTFKNSDKNSSVLERDSFNESIKVDPFNFIPNSNGEFVALDSWKKLEPNNPNSFNFYIYAVKVVPLIFIGQFVSEICKDNSIENKGAVFVHKVKTYIKKT